MGSFAYLTGLVDRGVAIDLGTANTLVYVRGRGIVVCEPSLVAVDSRGGNVCAVGNDAARLVEGGFGSTTGVRPIRDGVITDLEVAAEMVRQFVQKACRRRRIHPAVMAVGVPRCATVVERRAVEEACHLAGARHTYVIEEPLAAAIGAGLPVTEAAGSMVVDIGAGTTEVALISLGEIVVAQSIRLGGDEFDAAIVRHLAQERELLISQRTAEEVKLQVGSALPPAVDAQIEVHGHDPRSALPKPALLRSSDIRGALERPAARIVDAVKETLGRTPPELGGDLIERGMILAGGGSLLRGLRERLRQETQMPVDAAELPLTCVAAGAGAWLEELHDDRFREFAGSWR